ncbi:MAG: DUF2953 domain-containing protein [Lachnospiraceae bacterium]|nr:DUF2953 domain-containing protein [Lachnospiraceae bacterium]
MGVLILILKIIGITLLVLVGLILLVLCLVLFVPVRYRADAAKGNETSLSGHARATWLLSILSAAYDYTDEKKGLTLRVFGIRLKSREEKENLKAKHGIRHKGRTKKEKHEDISDDPPDYTIFEYDSDEDSVKQVESLMPSVHDGNDNEVPEEKEAKPKIDLEEKISRIYGFILRFKDRISDILSGIGKAFDSFEYYSNALFNDSRNRDAISLIIKKVKRLLESIKPRRISGHLDYGSEDPANTGKVLAIASVLYPLYGPGIEINPDFENNLLSFDLKIKGRIYINVIAAVLLQLYFNRKVRRFIHIMKKENENGK